MRRNTQSDFTPMPATSMIVAGGDYLLDNASNILATENGLSSHLGRPIPALVNGKSRPENEGEPREDEEDDKLDDMSDEESNGLDCLSFALINVGEEDQLEAYGYRKYMPYVFSTWILYLITFGLLRLVLHWKPQWRLYLTHVRCSMVVANRIMLIVR